MLLTDKCAPVVCHEGLKKTIEDVQKCYQNTPVKYLQIEQCMVVEVVVVMMVNYLFNKTMFMKQDKTVHCVGLEF